MTKVTNPIKDVSRLGWRPKGGGYTASGVLRGAGVSNRPSSVSGRT